MLKTAMQCNNVFSLIYFAQIGRSFEICATNATTATANKVIKTKGNVRFDPVKITSQGVTTNAIIKLR
jgi:hypothetical protein